MKKVIIIENKFGRFYNFTLDEWTSELNIATQYFDKQDAEKRLSKLPVSMYRLSVYYVAVKE